MFDSTRVDSRLLDATALVIEEFQQVDAAFDPATAMIVGAQCRDILHAGLGHDFPLRATTDLDVAVVVADWDVYGKLVSAFAPSGDTGIRFIVAGIMVDLMPFGAVEKPRGTVSPARRGESMDVFAFQEVFGASIALRLPNGAAVRLASPAGYTALKMKAWIDRSAAHNDKDAPDLAAALWWYSEAPAVLERLYTEDAGIAILERFGFDIPQASSYLLGIDVYEVVGSARGLELSSLWRTSDHPLLADRMTNTRLGASVHTRSDWITAIEALGAGLDGTSHEQGI